MIPIVGGSSDAGRVPGEQTDRQEHVSLPYWMPSWSTVSVLS
jgi:hypothetical protein